GKSIAEKVQEYLETGAIQDVEDLRAKIPPGVLEMMSISGLGPKKAWVLYQELGIASVPELGDAIKSGRLKGMKGFGAKTEENILHGIDLMQQSGDRVLISVALELADEIVGSLRDVKSVQRTEYAGSLRRMAETIGDVDILVASETSGPIMDAFVALPVVAEVIGSGETKTSVRTTRGLQVDLRVIPPGAWGAASIYFTGSKAHNIRIREIAVRKKLKLSEYGLFPVDGDELLGMQWVPPTLREDRGEVEAALKHELPDLIQLKDIRGDLHTHTNLTDGLATLEQMLETAAARKYAYYAVTDHAPNLYMQRMTDEKMLAQRKQLAKLAAGYKMTLLHGTELNIDAEGEVDWGPEFLSGFDVTVASVHGMFNLSKDEMTRRIVRACENPYVNIIGHPTARKIGHRAPIEYDLDEVFAAAARTGTALEINAYPDRLDLRDEHVMWAKRHGVKFSIDTDSHSTVHLEHMKYGIGTAQRGWVTKDDVINAWPLSKLKKFF